MRYSGLEFIAKGELAFCDLGTPSKLEPTEILLETKYTALTNGTERHAFLSEHGYGGGRFPSRHGYQHIGRVVSTGGEVTQFEPGDWLFYGQYVGHNGWNIINEDALLIKLPVGIDYRYCALFGVAGVALRSVRRMGVSQDDNVWVVGQGPIGHFLAQVARSAGAKVTVSDMIDRRLDAAKECGAHIALKANSQKAPEIIKEGRPYDYIYDCCSVESLLSDICDNRLLAHSGTVGLIAVRDQITYPWNLLHGTEAKIETSCHFDKDDLRVLLFLYEQGYLQIAPMVSHIVTIDEAPQIYKKLADNASDLFGVIFDWTENV